MGDGGYCPDLVPRLCHIVRWPDFNGYGFNLHAEKGKAGQFIGKVDEGSPAEAAGLKAGDRIVEVNGTNIGNENHQQVVGRIKAGGDETRLLVVDPETDQHYKEEKKVVRGDLPEVKFLTAARDEDNEATQSEEAVTVAAAAVVTEDTNGTDPEPQQQTAAAEEQEDNSSQFVPRLCNLCKWPDFDGYGFNLHAEKDKPGQYIGLIDPDSPAETGGLKEGDRIIEVNGENIESSTHAMVIQKIKSSGDRTSMLVVDRATDEYFKGKGQSVCSSMTSVVVISTPPRLAVVDTEQEGVAHVAAYQWDTDEPVPSGAAVVSYGAEVEGEALPPPPDSAGWDVDTSFPEPAVDLSDTEETAESVTAVVSQQVETSAPVPDEPPTVYNGTAANGINGGSTTVESQAEATVVTTKMSEPEPAVIGSTATAAPGGDDLLHMSAAEMKERLKSRKKQDPRQNKTSFETKYKMFEKM
ncbi:Na(+)/H(+) exchange regulatory cofactor NHE-RF1-like isoform X2 [Babylonia areolata]|uniref:Na(+)/H(+) exchange regulatory cofactor NHE-RF1-like isoform X2 n=1 Tax=Babylonia areolata TaxID=304850 RepID=UPI003FD2F3B3